MPVDEIVRHRQSSEATFAGARQHKQSESVVVRLKQLVADLSLDKAMRRMRSTKRKR